MLDFGHFLADAATDEIVGDLYQLYLLIYHSRKYCEICGLDDFCECYC